MIWGLIILYALTFVGLGVHLAKHGEQREDNYNVWTTLIASALQFVLIWWALGWRFF